MTKIFGHRGAKAYYAENTLTSFRKALEMGADGLELDIHYSKDGEIIVFHDFTLERMCGVNGNVYDYTLDELKQLKVQFKNQYEQIPTLKEVLELINSFEHETGKVICLNVEFKAGSDFYPEIEAKTHLLCNAYLSKSQLIYSSFDHYALLKIKALDPDAQTGILTASAMVAPWEYTTRLNADFYHPAYQSLTDRMLREIKQHALSLNAYTINDTSVAKGLILYGINGIITDMPDIMIELRNNL
ncbi:MAG: hypothetical protein BGO41_04565 [Clostridiales bacterium 38-18]|nr:MAG: hypothetical protein BGO41_04565 [Clostridiales bacterium 38-18]